MTKPTILRQLRDDIRGFGFKQWFLLLLNLILLLAMAASLVGLRAVTGTLGAAMTGAERFQGGSETRFAQLASFLPVGEGKAETDILQFRQTLDTKLTEQSLEAPENGSLYLDAYSGSASVTVVGDHGSATADAIGVGGDFFFFHPLPLRSGSYISSDDLMDDLVVLDEEMAWRLFGGTDLTGLPLTINGVPFVVAGVVDREDDFASQKAYSGEAGLFLSFSALQRLVEDAGIDCYEIVMPDPISGYAKGILTESFPNADVVENSSRYSLGHLWEVLRGFGQRSMRANGVIYPYWENAARLTEDYAVLLLLLSVLLALCPAIFLTVTVIRYIRRGYRFVKATVPVKVEAAVEQRKEERLERQYKKKPEENDPWQT